MILPSKLTINLDGFFVTLNKVIENVLNIGGNTKLILLKAKKLITGDGKTIIEDGGVVFDKDKILAVGKAEKLSNDFPQAEWMHIFIWAIIGHSLICIGTMIL